MCLEGIRFTYLLLACTGEVKASKEEITNTYADLLSSIDKSNFSYEQREILNKISIFEPPYVQKVNDKMMVMEGVNRLQVIQAGLDYLNIDYSNVIFPCIVEYPEKFNIDKLQQVKR